MNNSIELSDIELEAVVGGVLDSQSNSASNQNAALLTNTTANVGVIAVGNAIGNVGVGQDSDINQKNISNKFLSL
jgi:hypothetical protein